jgi:uridine kinase
MLSRRPYIIGIAGSSASGKTYILDKIKGAFSASQVCIFSMDNYYKPLPEQQKDKNGKVNFDVPEAIDINAFINDLNLLVKGQSAERLEYTFNKPGSIPLQLRLLSAPVLIIEGLFIFHIDSIKELLNLKIFLDSREDIKLQRRIKRDKDERGIAEETVLYQWYNHVIPGYNQFLQPYIEEADIVLPNNNNCDKGIEVLVHHITCVLRSMKHFV